MTPEQTIELAKQANEYADIEYESHWKSGLFVKEHWQSIRDKRFAELVRNEVLEDAAVACEELARDWGDCAEESGMHTCRNMLRSMKK